MPYRIRWHEDGITHYVGRARLTRTQNPLKARLYPSIGAIKNSLNRWGSISTRVEIVEVELQETGVVLNAAEVMLPHQEQKRREVEESRTRRLIEIKEQELSELKRLQEKYR